MAKDKIIRLSGHDISRVELRSDDPDLENSHKQEHDKVKDAVLNYMESNPYGDLFFCQLKMGEDGVNYEALTCAALQGDNINVMACALFDTILKFTDDNPSVMKAVLDYGKDYLKSKEAEEKGGDWNFINLAGLTGEKEKLH